MRRVQFSIHSRKRMHACHVNVYTEKRQKGGARACTCACACASLASKPTLNASRDRFRLRLHREKASSIHFSLFFFLLFLLFLFFFYLFFFWSPDTSNDEFQSGYTFLVSRQKIVIYTNIRRIQARYRCSKRQSFQTGNKNCFILLYWGEKKQNKKKEKVSNEGLVDRFCC